MNIVSVYNTDTEAIPPFGVAQIFDWKADGSVSVGRVVKSGWTDVLVNGQCPILPLSAGQMHGDFPIPVLLASSPDAAVSGQIWGTIANQWSLGSQSTGFIIRSAPDNYNVALAEKMPHFYWQLVRVTSPASLGTNFSDGYETVPDPGADTFSVGSAVKIRDPNNLKLTAQYYMARLSGNRNGVPTYYTVAGLGDTIGSSSSSQSSVTVVTGISCSGGNMVVTTKVLTGSFSVS